jgi:hypothetical protein
MAHFQQISVNMRKLKMDYIEADFTYENCFFRGIAPGEDRTHNLWLRRPTLYPVELRAQQPARNLAADQQISIDEAIEPENVCVSIFSLQSHAARMKMFARPAGGAAFVKTMARQGKEFS